jgi:hypothetical protein
MTNGEAAAIIIGMTNGFLISGFPKEMPAHEISQWADQSVVAGLTLAGAAVDKDKLDALEAFAMEEMEHPSNDRFTLKGYPQLQAVYAAEANAGNN